MQSMLKTLAIFILAGLAEIGGGYLIWLWLRESKSFLLGIAGGLILVLYGVIPTLQEEQNFGRIYAAYGGIFIILSTLWGWWIDKKNPDIYDWVGAGICLIGISIIMCSPRN